MDRTRGLHSGVSDRGRYLITCQPTIRNEKRSLVRASNNRYQPLERRDAVGSDALGGCRCGPLTGTEQAENYFLN
ncbi:hypothetical protein C485_03508 [Natrinema altunense JCM 12890]|uniref:Uncharacterized protein n=1 Tax=Natrinema altunense (strain JCM 12890 / CGMCC 1.3731 / AJ2) TaxID=1227494 RepID=L9ZY70_NATA2|nr:hypothetical protein C485_03508 [Natrinema altunense JCM 12890]